jgi:hypothetical protein
VVICGVSWAKRFGSGWRSDFVPFRVFSGQKGSATVDRLIRGDSCVSWAKRFGSGSLSDSWGFVAKMDSNSKIYTHEKTRKWET